MAVEPKTRVSWKVEAGPHDSHHRVGVFLNDQGFADGCRIAAEAILPESMLEHDNLGGSGLAVLRQERAADQRVGAEHRKQIVPRPRAGDLDGRVIAVDHRQLRLGVGRHIGKGLVLVLIVRDVGWGHELARNTSLQVRGPDSHQLTGFRIGEILQQHAVHYTEDRRVGTDPESDGDDGHQREGRVLP